MRVLGTAGHVDHGKSTLVKSLTGIDPDRLQEEKDRQMTIDLGFAWMTLPSGEGLGIIDVPGHRDFIDNMLAGVGGIDAALLVIAADEGVMPQTREHLSILDLLETRELIVALTKVDLVQSSEWLDLVRDEIQSLLARTRFSNARILPVSSFTGQGVEDLVRALDVAVAGALSRPDLMRPRLAVDRAFTMAGFGTVVTGTLVDGGFQVGEDVELLPEGLQARVRGLQTHKEAVNEAVSGSRVAVNLSGIRVDQVERGDVLIHPGTDIPSEIVDVNFRVLADAATPIRHNSSAKFFSGSANRMARIRVLGEAPLQPGESGWLQLLLDAPIVVRRGDRFILRRPSPGATLGGGRIADPHPPGRHKRRDSAVIDGLNRLLSESPEEVLLQSVSADSPSRLALAVEAAGLDPASAEAAIRTLQQEGKLVVLSAPDLFPDVLAIREPGWTRFVDRATMLVQDYHASYSLRSGIPLEELRSRLAEGSTEMIEALLARGILRQSDNRISLPGFRVKFTPAQGDRVNRLLGRFDADPYGPPSLKDSLAAVGEDLLAALFENGQLVKLSETVILTGETYSEMVDRVRAQLRDQATISVAEVRDIFGTSRKYALALMEHLDQIGLTVRDGDIRRLKSTPES